MTRPHLRRSVLFLPASNPRAVAKARELACDVVVLDLEDAVAPEAKEEAREAAVAAIAEGFGHREVVLRVNGPSTPWGEADLLAAVRAAPHAVLAPKVDTADEVRLLNGALCAAPERVRLWAMIETPRAVLNVGEIAAEAASTRLAALVVGLNDLGAATRARPTPGREAFGYALAAAVTAARAYGLLAIDGVHNAPEDEVGFEAVCQQGRDFGFDGKSLIHPRQIGAANRAFSPSQEEFAWAEAVAAAFADPANSGRGAVRVEGKMAEALHLEEARRILGFRTVEVEG